MCVCGCVPLCCCQANWGLLPKLTPTHGNSIYAGHSEPMRAVWKVDSSCDTGDAYVDKGASAMLLVVEGPAYESITLSAERSDYNLVSSLT